MDPKPRSRMQPGTESYEYGTATHTGMFALPPQYVSSGTLDQFWYLAQTSAGQSKTIGLDYIKLRHLFEQDIDKFYINVKRCTLLPNLQMLIPIRTINCHIFPLDLADICEKVHIPLSALYYNNLEDIEDWSTRLLADVVKEVPLTEGQKTQVDGGYYEQNHWDPSQEILKLIRNHDMLMGKIKERLLFHHIPATKVEYIMSACKLLTAFHACINNAITIPGNLYTEIDAFLYLPQ